MPRPFPPRLIAPIGPPFNSVVIFRGYLPFLSQQPLKWNMQAKDGSHRPVVTARASLQVSLGPMKGSSECSSNTLRGNR